MHGSAPDIAGKGIANPIAMIASFGMALRYSFNLGKQADWIDKAISATLAKGLRTAVFYTRLYNRSLRTGLAIVSPAATTPQLPMAKAIRAAETAVNTWYDHAKIAA